jgi:hypothetical protein
MERFQAFFVISPRPLPTIIALDDVIGANSWVMTAPAV